MLRSFQKLDIWRKAQGLALDTYAVPEAFRRISVLDRSARYVAQSLRKRLL